MENLSRVSIGYDLRIDSGIITNDQRMNGYILSADPNILPRAEAIQDLLDNNLWQISNPLNLFLNQQLVNKFYLEFIHIQPLLKICITCFPLSAHSLIKRFGSDWLDTLSTEEQLISQGWKLMGFDAIDIRGLISGLTGCGQNVIVDIAKTYLNSNHLFAIEKDTIKFSEAQGIMIPEHAPFVIVGILIHS